MKWIKARFTLLRIRFLPFLLRKTVAIHTTPFQNEYTIHIHIHIRNQTVPFSYWSNMSVKQNRIDLALFLYEHGVVLT